LKGDARDQVAAFKPLGCSQTTTTKPSGLPVRELAWLMSERQYGSRANQQPEEAEAKKHAQENPIHFSSPAWNRETEIVTRGFREKVAGYTLVTGKLGPSATIKQDTNPDTHPKWVLAPNGMQLPKWANGRMKRIQRELDMLRARKAGQGNEIDRVERIVLWAVGIVFCLIGMAVTWPF
jgi:hypothetical protein